ncbi:MAG: sorbosone dehydrogenase family protein [Candidatus Rokubacteria bacterium]|nr:sorbosone dehydrogenase family protein [Candidatus Rokubacteria bacterium]
MHAVDAVPEAARRIIGLLASLAVLGLLPSTPASADEPRLTLPPGFQIQVFAAGLGAARFMALDPTGTVLVSVPSEGRILALPDRDGDGRADAIVTVASDLDLPHGLVVRPGHLYVAETGRVLRFRYDPTRLGLSDATVIVPNLPPGAHHWSRTIALDAKGSLYVAVGSSCDVCREQDHRRAAIVRYNADGSGERLVARGLRNPVGLAFHPATGALWTTVNERDWPSGGAPPDYLTEVKEGAFYGWPDCFVSGRKAMPDPELHGGQRCAGVTLPTLEIPPHSAPLGLTFYTGTRFPRAYRGSLFVAYHGSRPGLLPPAGYKVVRVTFERGRPAGVEDFVTGWREGDHVRGRPVDLLQSADGALLISDDHAGRIYRVTFRP